MKGYLPYEIKLPPTQIYLRISNRNPANRYVVTGVLNSKQGLQEEIKWSKDPEVLANNEAYAKLSPTEVARVVPSTGDWRVTGIGVDS